MTEASADGQATVIKKYANRRLYNTATSRYVTLDDLAQMVRDGEDFVVTDAKSGEDLTRAVLTQIIVEQEAKGTNLLPIGFLRQLIALYGDNMQWMVPSYLEQSMRAFGENQDRLRNAMSEAFGSMFPFGSVEQMGKQNMAMMENAMRLFSPFGDPKAGTGTAPQPAQDQADLLLRQIEALQAEIERLKTAQTKR